MLRDGSEALKSRFTLEYVNVDLSIVIELIDCVNLGLSKASVLTENDLVLLLPIDVALRMHELASLPIGAEFVLVEQFTGLGHEVLGEMCLFYNLVGTMSVAASVAPLARAEHFPVLAELGLLLPFVLFHELLPVLFDANFSFVVMNFGARHSRAGTSRRIRFIFVKEE